MVVAFSTVCCAAGAETRRILAHRAAAMGEVFPAMGIVRMSVVCSRIQEGSELVNGGQTPVVESPEEQPPAKARAVVTI